MRIRLILVGRSERGHVADGLKHYLDRIRRMEGLEEVLVPDAGKGEPAWQQRTESERILAAIKPGERVVALVVPAPGAQVDPADIIAHARKFVAGYKVPKEVHLVDEIRRTPAGKSDVKWAKDTAASLSG